jgi:hypothetical protein
VTALDSRVGVLLTRDENRRASPCIAVVTSRAWLRHDDRFMCPHLGCDAKRRLTGGERAEKTPFTKSRGEGTLLER